MKLKNSTCDETIKLKLGLNSETQNLMIIKTLNCDKNSKTNCE